MLDDFIQRHHVVATVAVIWVMGLITYITHVWAQNVNTMTGSAAALGTSLVGLFGLAALNLRRTRGIGN